MFIAGAKPHLRPLAAGRDTLLPASAAGALVLGWRRRAWLLEVRRAGRLHLQPEQPLHQACARRPGPVV